MINLKIRADSKQDGISREHVISPRPVFAVDKGEHDYVNVSASAGQIWSWGRVGREGDLKNCANLWKNPGYAPAIYMYALMTSNLAG